MFLDDVSDDVRVNRISRLTDCRLFKKCPALRSES